MKSLVILDKEVPLHLNAKYRNFVIVIPTL